MPVINVESGSGNAVCPCSCHFGAAGRTESAFTGIADDVVAVTIWTFIDLKAHGKRSAGDHAGHFIKDVLLDDDAFFFDGDEKMFPKLMKDELKCRLVWIISPHICFGRSFYNRTCKIIGDWHSSNSYLNYSRPKK